MLSGFDRRRDTYHGHSRAGAFIIYIILAVNDVVLYGLWLLFGSRREYQVKRKTAFIIYGIMAVIFLAVTAFEFNYQSAAKKESSETVTASEAQDPFDGLVQTVSGTTTDMLKAEYWLASNKEQLLFSKEEIAAFTDNNPAYLEYKEENNTTKQKLYMYDLPESIYGDIVETLIDPEIIEDIASDGKVLYANGEEISGRYFDEIRDNLNLSAIKFLGKIYGYGGTLSSNDCSGFIRQVYSCFGFELPRNARAIATVYDLGSIDCNKMTLDKKRSLLEEMPPGLLAFMDGHIMMYLGTKDGVPYVISSCATCIEPGHDTSDIVDAYGVFVSSMELRRANENTWLEDISYILWKEY